MESIIHFFKHAIGLCGEAHPSLLMGGFGIVGYCAYCIKNLSYRRNKCQKKK